MFNFRNFIRFHGCNILVSSEEQGEASWDNIAQLEHWACSELNKIQDQYFWLKDLYEISSQVYIEIEEGPFDFAQEWIDAQ